MTEKLVSESFTLALTACQSRLHAYIMALTLDANVADDILQASNLALCRRSDEFPQIRDFTGWACKIAHLEVLRHWKSRDRCRVLFDSNLIEAVGQELQTAIDEFSFRQQSLRDCMKRLPEKQRAMILKRYCGTVSVDELASESGQPVKSIYQALYRIRLALMNCINRKLAAESHG